VEQADLLRKVIDVLEQQDIVYMPVGSMASSAYGEPRATADIDMVVQLRLEEVHPLCEAFPDNEYDVSEAAASDAVRRAGQFNLIHPASGSKVDFMIARADLWGRAQLSRRRRTRILPDREGYIASPEDIIISKMIYYREGGSEKHLRDITGVLKVSGDEVDRDYIHRWACDLRLRKIWQSILRRLAGG
jgi:hypothetical protein